MRSIVVAALAVAPLLLGAGTASAQDLAAPVEDAAPRLSVEEAAPRLSVEDAAPRLSVEDAAPRLPAGMAASFVPPLQAADGRYATPNRDLSADETTWHVRVALNVAALGCRDADGAATTAAYNLLLDTEKTALDLAGIGMAARYRMRFGAAWQARHDDAMTRLYNFWAQPPAHDGFCATAHDILREAATVEPSNFAAFAATALPRLEAPFVAAFAAADAYRAQVATWRDRHAPRIVIATSAVVPVTGRLGPDGP